jgi:hypothetical protein
MKLIFKSFSVSFVEKFYTEKRSDLRKKYAILDENSELLLKFQKEREILEILV